MEVSWFQEKPLISLQWISELQPGKDARILDVGGGDSRLVDFLLQDGYRGITVLDISEKALQRAQERLGEQARLVRWMEVDAVDFVIDGPVDLWHDRAAFHFLTDEADIKSYVRLLKEGVKAGGHAIIATFSKEGPTRCSGIPIKQCDTGELEDLLAPEFELRKFRPLEHQTPSGAKQHFTFTAFRRVSGK